MAADDGDGDAMECTLCFFCLLLVVLFLVLALVMELLGSRFGMVVDAVVLLAVPMAVVNARGAGEGSTGPS